MITNASILIIEHQKKIAENMRQSLSQMGYQNILIAPTNSEGLKKLKHNSPDIVFKDICLEDNSSSTKAAHKIVHDKHIPMVYVTSENGTENHNKLNTKDPYETMIKPDDESQLKYSIESAIRIHELEKKLFETESQMHLMIKNEHKYQYLIENASEGIIFVNEKGIISEVNEALCKMTGIPREDLLGKEPLDLAKKLLKGKVLAKVIAVTQNMFKGNRTTPYNLEFNQRILEINAPKMQGTQGYTVIFHDITEECLNRIKTEEIAAKYLNIFENANDGMIYLNTSGYILDVNSRALQTLGLRRSNIVNHHFRELTFISKNDTNEIENKFKKAVKKDKLTTNITIKNKHGKLIHLECISTRIMHRKQVEGVLIIARDVSERIHHDHLIRASLKEKEILLQEIHHRVKNNLQIISSLLHLQSFQFTDQKIIDCIQQSQNRIKTMAILHEQLYQADNFSKIDFEYYIRTITRHLLHQYSDSSKRISVQLDFEKCDFSIENAVYCGLIINELTTNAFKYAFTDQNEGHISISLKKISKNPDVFELMFQSDGLPIPEHIDIRTTKSLGLRLVRLLSEDQMQGELIYMKKPLTTFKIVFKQKKPYHYLKQSI